MRSSKVVFPILLVCLLIGLSGWAGDSPILPDLDLSMAWCEYSGSDPVVVVNFPNGEGKRFDEARISGGAVNGTIHVILLDAVGRPFPDYPSEDLWLESNDSHLSLCPEGSSADAFTDVNGETTWVLPLRAGGYSEDYARVIVNGMHLSGPGLNVHFNSPDINGDLRVNLSDLPLFTHDYFGEYLFRSDFHFDHIINLSDVTILVRGMNASCP